MQQRGDFRSLGEFLVGMQVATDVAVVVGLEYRPVEGEAGFLVVVGHAWTSLWVAFAAPRVRGIATGHRPCGAIGEQDNSRGRIRQGQATTVAREAQGLAAPCR